MAVLTDIDIASRALLRLGAETIQTFDDNSREAEVAGNLYTHVYESLLGQYYWNFATQTADLNLLAAAPDDPYWDNQFQLPSGYINVVNILDSSGYAITERDAYKIEGSVVLSNYDTLKIKYVYKPDESALPPWFVEYFVYALAYQMNEAITGDQRLASEIQNERDNARRFATKADGLEQPDRSALAPSALRLARES